MLGQFASTMALAYLTALHLAAMTEPHSGHTTKQDNFLVYSGESTALRLSIACREEHSLACPWISVNLTLPRTFSKFMHGPGCLPEVRCCAGYAISRNDRPSS